MLSRHPELARKMKANSAGERVLDEEAMRTARAILRKENKACFQIGIGLCRAMPIATRSIFIWVSNGRLGNDTFLFGISI